MRRRAMLELTELLNPGEPFPRKPKIVFESEYELIKKYGFTLDEIENALKRRSLIRGKFILTLSHLYLTEIPHDRLFAGYTPEKTRTAIIDAMREQTIDDIIREYAGGLIIDEIKKLLGLSDTAWRNVQSRLGKKMRHHRNLAENLFLWESLRDRRAPCQITIRQKITIH
jgi:hypothetical protein